MCMCVYVYSSIVEPSGPHAWCCRCPRRYLSINKTLSLSLLSTLSLCWRGGSPVYSSSLALSLSLPPTQEATDHLASIAMTGSLISKGSQVPFAGHSDTTRVMRLEVPQRTARRRPLLARGHARPPRQILLSLPSCRDKRSSREQTRSVLEAACRRLLAQGKQGPRRHQAHSLPCPVCCELVPESELRPMEAFGGTFQASCNCTAPRLPAHVELAPNSNRGVIYSPT